MPAPSSSDEPLREVGGFGDLPSRWTFNRFVSRLSHHTDLVEAALANPGSQPPLDVHIGPLSETVVTLHANRLDGVDGDAPAGVMLHLIDTTEQKNLELQFAQSQKMQAVGQLAGGIAHDFNNLLTAMMGFCDLLLMRHQAGDPSFADIMQVKQNANRAAGLVRQLLAFSRRQTLQPKVLVLTDVLAELANLLRRLIGENIELKMVHARNLGLVKVDQGQIELGFTVISGTGLEQDTESRDEQFPHPARVGNVA